MKVRCPNCRSDIANNDINVSSDVAYCHECTNIFKLSELLNKKSDVVKPDKINLEKFTSYPSNVSQLPVYEKTELINNKKTDIDIEHPPNGVWLNKFYNGFEITATTRSAIAFFMVPFMIVWSGGSIGGIYISQIINGKFNLTMSLFGIPFLLGSIIFWTLTLIFCFGKVSVKVENNDGRIFTGVGSTGVQKFFKVDEINRIVEEYNNGQSNTSIVLEGKHKISFGGMINSERRYFFIKALKKLMNK